MRIPKSILTTLSVVILLAVTYLVSLAHGVQRGQAKATIGKAHVSIDYGRPSLNGRDLTKVIKPGQLWRIGADDPTTIESDADLDFGGTRLPAGKHILLARLVEPGKWSLVVSSKDVFHYDPAAKIAEVSTDLEQASDSVEDVSIHLTSKGGRGVIEIAWGTLRLSASFAPAR